MSALNIENIEN